MYGKGHFRLKKNIKTVDSKKNSTLSKIMDITYSYTTWWFSNKGKNFKIWPIQKTESFWDIDHMMWLKSYAEKDITVPIDLAKTIQVLFLIPLILYVHNQNDAQMLQIGIMNSVKILNKS